MSDRPGLIVFDLDGTLFRTELSSVPAVQEAFSELGLPLPSRTEILSYFGRTASEFNAWVASQCSGPEQVATVVDRVELLELTYVAERGQLYPGVRRALQRVRTAGLQMVLCSNGHSRYVNRVLDAHRLRPFFDRIRCWTAPGDNKAAMVAELLAQFAGRPVIVVGDRHDDVEAAHRNGGLAIAAAYGYGSAAEWADADAVAESPRDLPRAIQDMMRKA